MLKIITFALAALVVHKDVQAQAEVQARPLKHAPAHVGLVYPLSTNGRQAKEYSNNFSLHVIAGVSGAETGIALSGFALVIKDSASGLQASGFAAAISTVASCRARANPSRSKAGVIDFE